MKLLKKLIIYLVAWLVLLVLVGFVLPSSANVERSIAIQASPSTVFPFVNGYEKFNQWSPWYNLDPNASYTYEGPASGVGAKMSWQSDDPNVGSGTQEIIESREFELVKTELDFGPQGIAVAYFNIEAQDDGCEVTWGFDTEFGYNIIGRYFGLLFDRLIGPDYEKGLKNLKELAESAPKAEEARSPETALQDGSGSETENSP